jgi:hypothetical protein
MLTKRDHDDEYIFKRRFLDYQLSINKTLETLNGYYENTLKINANNRKEMIIEELINKLI